MSERRRFALLCLAAAGATLFGAIALSLAEPGTRVDLLLGAASFTVAPVLAAAAALWRAARDRSRAWAYLGLSFGMWATGSLVWVTNELVFGSGPTFPSLAEIGYLGYVLPACVGLASLPLLSGVRVGRWWGWLDGSVVASSVLVISWATVMGPAITQSSGGLGPRLAAAAYPLVDVTLASLVLALGMRAPAADRLQWTFLGTGLATLAVTNGVYASRADTFAPGTLLDLGWVAAFLLAALAALVPRPTSPRALPAQVRRAQVVQHAVPYLPVSAAIATAALRSEPVADDTVLTALGAVALALFLLRQVLLVVENTRLTGDLTTLVNVRTAELAQEKANVDLLRTVATAANTAPSLEDALQRTLDAVCEHTGWQLGHAFLLPEAARPGGARELRHTNVWHVDDALQFDAFVLATRTIHFPPGVGLPGRVLSTSEPAWSADLRADQNFLRAEWAQKADLEAGFAFPVLVRDDLVGVLEFFTTSVTPHDPVLVEAMSHVGTQLGRVVERHWADERLRHLATHDVLTGLPNRTLLSDRVEQALVRMAHGGGPVAVLVIDLDGFREINDSLGHAAGDELLREVARRLKDGLRATDTVARLGGDEFAVLVQDAGDPFALQRRATDLLESIATHLIVAGRTLTVSASVGVAVAGEELGESVGELLRNAELAMYHAKDGGKARFTVFQPDWHAVSVAKLELEADLRLALERSQLVVHYQPVVDLASGRLVGTEALLRWLHPTRGMVAPLDFIPLAEETGLIRPIGTWVLDEAVRQTRAWQQREQAHGDLTVAVNVSVEQLRPGLTEEVASVLSRHGFAPGCLVLEVTESLLVGEETTTIAVLRELSELGVRVAVDDFGTGYSALHRMRQFPVDVLKVDRSFVAQLGEGAGDPLVTAMISLGHGLGLEVVAEGVETPEQLRFLREHRCDVAQGYLLSAPLPAERLEPLLAPGAWPWVQELAATPARRPIDRLDADLLDLIGGAIRGEVDVETLVRPILAKLEEITGLESTYFSSVQWDEGGQSIETQTIDVARNAGAIQFPEGAVLPWSKSLCQHIVDGPVTSDDVRTRFPASTVAVEYGIQSFTGVAIRRPDGEVCGTLCGISSTKVSQQPDTVALMELFARVIGQLMPSTQHKLLTPLRHSPSAGKPVRATRG